MLTSQILATANFVSATGGFGTPSNHRANSVEKAGVPPSFEAEGTWRRTLRNKCLVMLLIGFCYLPTQAQLVAAGVADPAGVMSFRDSAKSLIPPYATVISSPHSYVPLTEEASNVSAAPASLSPGSFVVLNRPLPPDRPQKFNFKGAFWQSFGENLFYHVWRVASDPGMQWNLEHKPFFHDWFASYKGYDMHRWGDGDDFIVNDVGHPLEGAVFARTFLQNSPRSQVAIGKNSRYWTSRLKATLWSAAWSTQLEIGPLSETSIGNQGGFTYVPNCGIYAYCLNNPKFHKPPTNNTGWTDFVVTPLVGTAWVIGEDTIDKYIAAPVAVNHRILGGRILRTALEPSRSFAAIFAGKFPWDLPSSESGFVTNSRSHFPSTFGNFESTPLNHIELGPQYTNISLPVVSSSCSSVTCRRNLSGFGSNLGYNFSRAIAFDSSLNFIPEQQGTKPMIQGLFGFRLGARTQHVGIFAKVRPGFIYYEKAMTQEGGSTQSNLTRFATDAGGVVEYYPKQGATLRLDVGTTLVRYLTNRPDPTTYPLGSLLSTQYIVSQGNFQMSSSYSIRF